MKRSTYLLLLSLFLSTIGTEVQVFALSLYVFQKTGLASTFATILALPLIPRILLGPIAGVFVDNFNKKKGIVLLDLVSGLLLFLYMIFCQTNDGNFSLNSIYVLVVILNIPLVLYFPAIQTLLATYNKSEELCKALSLKSTLENLARLIAPIVGGILWAKTSIKFIFAINAFSFLLASFLEMFITKETLYEKKEKMTSSLFKKEFLSGLSYLKKNRELFSSVFIGCVYNFISASFFVGVNFIVLKSFRDIKNGYSLFQSIMISGAVLGSFISAYLPYKGKVQNNFCRSLVICAVILLFLSVLLEESLFSSFLERKEMYIIFTLFVFLRMIVHSIGINMFNARVQSIIDLDYMGRVMAIMGTLTMCSIPLGQMTFGTLFDIFSPSVNILILSGMLLLTSLYAQRSVNS